MYKTNYKVFGLGIINVKIVRIIISFLILQILDSYLHYNSFYFNFSKKLAKIF